MLDRTRVGTGSVEWGFSSETLARQELQAIQAKIAEILEAKGFQSFAL